jgi:hypothetical protein
MGFAAYINASDILLDLRQFGPDRERCRSGFLVRTLCNGVESPIHQQRLPPNSWPPKTGTRLKSGTMAPSKRRL